jgi:hypothetical protein
MAARAPLPVGVVGRERALAERDVLTGGHGHGAEAARPVGCRLVGVDAHSPQIAAVTNAEKNRDSVCRRNGTRVRAVTSPNRRRT